SAGNSIEYSGRKRPEGSLIAKILSRRDRRHAVHRSHGNSMTEATTLAAEAPRRGAPSPALHIDPDVFRQRFNERDFAVRHNLAEHPAFDVEQLVHLARITAETRPRDVYYDEDRVAPGQRWAEIARGQSPVDETIRRLETTSSWIMIWKSELVAPYGELLD